MALRIILALVLSALAVTFDSSGSQATDTEPNVAEVSPAPTWIGARVVGLDNNPVRSAEAQEVIAGFAELGLELPTVTIEFHESTAACNGYDGFIRYEQPAPVITICSELAYVLPHELAHAWVDANLTDAAKADYIERWGLASWDDPSDHRNDRGTEHAAFVIQQNLTANPPRMSQTWLDRAEAFELLTGLESPLSSGEQA